MKWIYDLTYEALKEEITTTGIKKFAADQVFQWIYEKIEPSPSNWTNVSKTNRDKLGKTYDTTLNDTAAIDEDKTGTKKFLFRLADGHHIEAVSIKEKDHYTFCISTQVGCALGCRFCATGRIGFKRDLSPGEILSQVLTLKKSLLPYSGKINIVLMGMGEPLLNYGNLKQALDIITSETGIGISPRNVTLSTAGILETLKQFEIDFPRIKISFSLNAPDAQLREDLMPISRKERPADILDYFRTTPRKHRITFEYVMLKGVNDAPENVLKIVKLLRGISCKINLIPYNPIEGFDFQTPEPETVETFADQLHAKGFTVIVRWSKGKGIKSACGQLAAEVA